jgi:hypothetical protein
MGSFIAVRLELADRNADNHSLATAINDSNTLVRVGDQ